MKIDVVDSGSLEPTLREDVIIDDAATPPRDPSP